jgi:acetyl esterase/lipase
VQKIQNSIIALAGVMLLLLTPLSGCNQAKPLPKMSSPVAQVLPTLESLPAWKMNPALFSQEKIQVNKTSDLPYTSVELLDVYSPSTVGNWPIVVVFHGAGDAKWTVGDLAAAIAEQGAVVFAPTLHTDKPGGSNKVSGGAEDAACAVRFARVHVSEFGGDNHRVIVVGTSLGGLMAALMTLAGDEFYGDCLTQEGSALPDAFVGLDGGYDPIPYIPQGVLKAAPDDCLKFDPFYHIGQKPKREGIQFIMLVGTYEIAQSNAQAFRDALEAAGYDVTLAQIPGVDHVDMGKPQPQSINAIASLLRSISPTK